MRPSGDGTIAPRIAVRLGNPEFRLDGAGGRIDHEQSIRFRRGDDEITLRGGDRSSGRQQRNEPDQRATADVAILNMTSASTS